MVVTLLKGLPKLAKKGWKQKRIDALSKAIEKVEKTNPNRLRVQRKQQHYLFLMDQQVQHLHTEL